MIFLVYVDMFCCDNLLLWEFWLELVFDFFDVWYLLCFNCVVELVDVMIVWLGG